MERELVMMQLARLHALAKVLSRESKELSEQDGQLRIELDDIAERARSVQAALYVLWSRERDRYNQLGNG